MSLRPTQQLHGQWPIDRLNPGTGFGRVSVDYASPILIKSGPVRKPMVTKGYVALFVCLSVKAMHLDAVTELMTAAFIATLRRFIARRGTPTTIWSDNGINFVRAANEISSLVQNQTITHYCSNQGVR